MLKLCTHERQVFFCLQRDFYQDEIFVFLFAKKWSRKKRSLWKWGWSLEILYKLFFVCTFFAAAVVCWEVYLQANFLKFIVCTLSISNSSEKMFTSASFFSLLQLACSRSEIIKISNKSKFYSTPRSKMFKSYLSQLFFVVKIK